MPHLPSHGAFAAGSQNQRGYSVEALNTWRS